MPNGLAVAICCTLRNSSGTVQGKASRFRRNLVYPAAYRPALYARDLAEQPKRTIRCGTFIILIRKF